MAQTTDERIINHLREKEAVDPEHQRSIASVAEALKEEIVNVQLAARRLRDKGRLVASSRNLDLVQPVAPPMGAGGMITQADILRNIQQHREKVIGPIWVWLGDVEVDALLERKRQDERDDLLRRQVAASERLVQQAESGPKPGPVASGSVQVHPPMGNLNPNLNKSPRNTKRPRYTSYVFFDVVGFTKGRSSNAQAAIIEKLNWIVHHALAAQHIGSDSEARILLPTGDGVCICLRHDADRSLNHLELALRILALVAAHNEEAHSAQDRFEIRVGVNEHLDLVVKDVNERDNLAGKGINLTQRIMSAGEGGHLLLSERVCDGILTDDEYLQKLRRGEIEIKGGQRITVYQYVDAEAKGLSLSEPASFAKSQVPTRMVGPSGVMDKWRLTLAKWTAKTKPDIPQGATFKEMGLSDVPVQEFSCQARGLSQYFRFGVKLLAHGKPVVGSRAVVNEDESLLVLIMRNEDSSAIGVMAYRGRTPILNEPHAFQPGPSGIVRFGVRIQGGNLYVKVNQTELGPLGCAPEVQKRLALLAWGDTKEYDVAVTDIKIR